MGLDQIDQVHLLEAIHDWTEVLDGAYAIYLDYSKAFDSVPRERLLAKLRAYGENQKVLPWIWYFLFDRTQRALVKCKLSPAVNSEYFKTLC